MITCRGGEYADRDDWDRALTEQVAAGLAGTRSFVSELYTAVQAGVVVANDGGASLKTTVLAAWPLPPTIDEPGAEKVVAE